LTSDKTLSISQASGSANGFLSSTDWTTFNNKQTQLNGTGFVKASGTSITYDNSTYLTTSSASSTYLPLTGGTLTGTLNGTKLNLNSGIDVSGDFSTSYHTNVSGLFRGYQVLIAPNNDYGQTRIHFANRPVTESFSNFGSGIRHKWGGSDARNSFLSLYTSSSSNLQIDAISIDAFGNVGINDTTPSYTLDVNGTLGVTGAATLSSTLAVTGAITLSTTTATPTSLLGKDGSNVVGNITVGSGLNLTSGVLTASNPIERYYFDLGTVAGQADNSTGTYNFSYSGNAFIVPTSLNGYCIDTVNIRAISCTVCPPAAGEKDYYMGVYKVSAGNRVTSTGATLQGSQITCNEYDLTQENVNYTLTTGDVWWVYLNGSYFSDMEIIKASFIVKKTCN